MSDRVPDDGFTPATAVPAEGARIGLFTCNRCGACVMLDPRDDSETSRLAQHAEWHRSLGEAIAANRPDPRSAFIGG